MLSSGRKWGRAAWELRHGQSGKAQMGKKPRLNVFSGSEGKDKWARPWGCDVWCRSAYWGRDRGTEVWSWLIPSERWKPCWGNAAWLCGNIEMLMGGDHRWGKLVGRTLWIELWLEVKFFRAPRVGWSWAGICTSSCQVTSTNTAFTCCFYFLKAEWFWTNREIVPLDASIFWKLSFPLR